jgi:hypothetical protein
MSIITKKAKCLLKSSLPYFAASSLESSQAFTYPIHAYGSDSVRVFLLFTETNPYKVYEGL